MYSASIFTGAVYKAGGVSSRHLATVYIGNDPEKKIYKNLNFGLLSYCTLHTKHLRRKARAIKSANINRCIKMPPRSVKSSHQADRWPGH